MSFSLILLVSSSLLFVVWGVVSGVEADKGQRLFLTSLRRSLDDVVIAITNAISRATHYVSRYLITLNWYYGLHAIFKTCMRFVAGVYFAIEKRMELNRQRVKFLRKEQRRRSQWGNPRTRLHEMTDHKKAIQLSETEKKKLKKKSLEAD